MTHTALSGWRLPALLPIAILSLGSIVASGGGGDGEVDDGEDFVLPTYNYSISALSGAPPITSP